MADAATTPTPPTPATTSPATPPSPTSPATPTTASSTQKSSSDRGETSALSTSQGATVIADIVVSKIAGIATREISGVHELGGGAARAVGALRDRIAGSSTNQSQGVSVEVGERQAAVDIDLVADFGVALPDLAADIRRNVIASVERMTGLQVTEVNIAVHDVYLEEDDVSADEPATSRVH